jgi:hypothetical protein
VRALADNPEAIADQHADPPQITEVAIDLPGVAGEICTDIRFTDDISFKLLSLVPLISGAGILGVLFSVSGDFPSTAATLGAFVGVFGSIVTFALYRWEVRNISTCSYLLKRAAALEKDFALPRNGHHLSRPAKPSVRFGRWHWGMGKTESERLLYTTVICSWLALPGVAALVA